MVDMRIYLPATLSLLAVARRQGRVTESPCVAFGVTPTLREWYAEGDMEELEYAALALAARQSVTLLAQDPSAPRRRVVLAADVPDAWVRPRPDGPRAALSVLQPVPWSALAAVHVDAPEAEPVVGAAANAWAAAVGGDADAQFTLDGAEDEELLWFAVQEVDELLVRTAIKPGDG